MREGRLVCLRWLEERDAEASLALLLRNRAFFQTYTPLRSESFYTLEGQLEQIRNARDKKEVDEGYLFGIFEKDTEELVGNLVLSEVLRGPLQSCYIGYYLDEACNGKGYMTEAVKLAVDYAFRVLKLHRLEAGVMPNNARSMRVLEKVGFHKEGVARQNVKINGVWEDHQVLAIVNEEEV
ncbi:GNAT family N-acetyltransferase [Cohnella pontilimi]|uniref:GNAT family N-acetyltransferase n=1 Tax=Cohnella pontilimi TaxID=2564100 RepID=UPI001FE71BBD|nr:GNAT family protein [Cohnella pontilimi]